MSNVIHCRKDGTWSGSFHICQEMQGQCSAPGQLNSNLKLQCPEGYAIGTLGALGEPQEGRAFWELRLVLDWVVRHLYRVGPFARCWGKQR